MKTQKVEINEIEEFNIEELVFDRDIYPRMFIDKRGDAYAYSQAMRAGAEFPPIVVGVYKGKQYGVDGWHRITAKKLLKKKTIKGIKRVYRSKLSMLKDSIKLNILHGRKIKRFEKSRLTRKLKDNGLSTREISELMLIPIDKLNVFLERTFKATNGTIITSKEIIWKSMQKQQFTETEMQTTMKKVNQKIFTARSAISLLKQLLELIRCDLLPLHDEETKELTLKLYEELTDRLEL